MSTALDDVEPCAVDFVGETYRLRRLHDRVFASTQDSQRTLYLECPTTNAEDAKSIEERDQQLRLGFRRPRAISRPRAMPETRSIDDDETVGLRDHVDEARRGNLFDHAAIAVKIEDRSALTLCHDMKLDAVDHDYPA